MSIRRIAAPACVAAAALLLTMMLASVAMASGEEATTISLVANAGSVTSPPLLSGRLVDSASVGIANATVVLESSVDGSPYEATATMGTDWTGSFWTRPVISRNTQFRVVYAGSPDRYASCSAVATATFVPNMYWVEWHSLVSPAAPLAIKWVSDAPDRESCVVTCTVVHETRGATRTIVAQGVFDPVSGKTRYTATTTLPYAGWWSANVSTGPHANHGASGEGALIEVGNVRLGLSANDYSVRPGSTVEVTGWAKDRVSGKPIVGDYVKLQRLNGYAWETVGTAKTNSYGKAYFSVSPKLGYLYRLLHPESKRYVRDSSDAKRISTYYKVTLSRAGHYLTKKVYLPGNVTIDREVTGFFDQLRIHNSTHTWSSRIQPQLPSPPIDGVNEFKVPKSGYYHFKLLRNVPYVTVTLRPSGSRY